MSDLDHVRRLHRIHKETLRTVGDWHSWARDKIERGFVLGPDSPRDFPCVVAWKEWEGGSIVDYIRPVFVHLSDFQEWS